jgi:hypothetical protein
MALILAFLYKLLLFFAKIGSQHCFLKKDAIFSAESWRKSPKIAENRRKSPKIAENRRKQ